MTREEILALVTDALREVGLEKQALAIEQFTSVEHLLSFTPTANDYDERVCPACDVNLYGDEVVHTAECSVLAAWKALNDPRYTSNEENRAAAERRRAEAAAVLAAELANPCNFMDGRGRLCNRIAGHAEATHRFRVDMTSANAMFRDLYSPAAIENLAYQDNPLLTAMRAVSGIEAWLPTPAPRPPLPADDPASKIITDLKREPSVIVSPFIKDGDAYLFEDQLAISPNDSRTSDLFDGGPVASLRRAQAALKKMAEEEK